MSDIQKWWIDDVEERVCGRVDHPKIGLDKLPWPDNEYVHIVMLVSDHEKKLATLKAENEELRKFKNDFNVKPWLKMEDDIQKLHELVNNATPLLDDVIDYVGEDCRIDHNGRCQEHNLAFAEDCYVSKIKNWLKRKKEVIGE